MSQSSPPRTIHSSTVQNSTVPPERRPDFADEWVRKVTAYRETLTRAKPAADRACYGQVCLREPCANACHQRRLGRWSKPSLTRSEADLQGVGNQIAYRARSGSPVLAPGSPGDPWSRASDHAKILRTIGVISRKVGSRHGNSRHRKSMGKPQTAL